MPSCKRAVHAGSPKRYPQQIGGLKQNNARTSSLGRLERWTVIATKASPPEIQRMTETIQPAAAFYGRISRLLHLLLCKYVGLACQFFSPPINGARRGLAAQRL
jgi:hypothetical protein